MEEILKIQRQFYDYIHDVDFNKYCVVYRGVEDRTWLNEPSLFRGGRLRHEDEYINEVIRKFPDEFETAHTIDILTQLQHYSCPTRMLDVSENFFVGLFFACGGWDQCANNEYYKQLLNVDGAVHLYKVPVQDVKSINSETVVLLSNIARLKYEGKYFSDLEWQCEKDQHGVWHNYELVPHPVEELVRKNVKDVNKVFLVKTKWNNPRVRAQYGQFFLFGGLSGIEGLEYADKNCILDQKVRKINIPFPISYKLGEIIIPADHKKTILKELSRYYGIDYPTLCPEKSDFIKNLENTLKL